ncbi:DUF5994 family protein [Terrabacter sp. C0L_2]|uniref:DUF5994 family protein n=1 Tax=Terrabacter sp. C0L_2 TaxID=3108389 RepID=UPI002ED55997|nr:DUF5994 family protein [Terrabacter sp. C0L_2]
MNALPRPQPHATPSPATPADPADPATGRAPVHPSVDASPTETSTPPSRLALSRRLGVEASDGVWWPRTADLRTEVPLLDVAIQERVHARIARIGYERGPWDDAPGRIQTSLGITHLGWFEHSRYPDHVILSLSNYQRLVLMVLPPGADEDAALARLDAASA